MASRCRAAHQFALTAATKLGLAHVQQLHTLNMGFGRAPDAHMNAMVSAPPGAAPAVTNPSLPQVCGRVAHAGTRMTKGNNPEFKHHHSHAGEAPQAPLGVGTDPQN